MLTAEQIIAMRAPGVTIPVGYLELAATRISACVPVDSQDYQTMLALQALHLYTMDQERASGASGSGIINSEKEGDLSVSYSDAVGVSGDLASTPWGVELNSLLNGYSVHVFTRFSDDC